jgi:hypothetical protein
VDYVVYHHDLELPWEDGLYGRLVDSGRIVVEAAAPEVTIFRWAGRP